MLRCGVVRCCPAMHKTSRHGCGGGAVFKTANAPRAPTRFFPQGCGGSKEGQSTPTLQIPLIWSKCEFQADFPTALEGKVNPDDWEAYVNTINNEVLVEYQAKWAKTGVEKQVQDYAAKKTASKAVVMAIPGVAPVAVVASAAESAAQTVMDKAQEKKRQKDWDEHAVPAIREYIALVQANMKEHGHDIPVLGVGTGKFEAIRLQQLEINEVGANAEADNKEKIAKIAEKANQGIDIVVEKLDANMSDNQKKVKNAVAMKEVPSLDFTFSE